MPCFAPKTLQRDAVWSRVGLAASGPFRGDDGGNLNAKGYDGVFGQRKGGIRRYCNGPPICEGAHRPASFRP